MKLGDEGSSKQAAAAGTASPDADPFLATLQGVVLQRVKGKHTGGWSYNNRPRVVGPIHAACSASRSVAIDIERFGTRSAELSIGAWLNHAMDMPSERHRTWRPTLAAVEAYRNAAA